MTDSAPLALADRHNPLSDHALDQLFRGARTFYAWEDRDVSDTTLKALYELLQFGPTSANQSPARFLFLKGEAQAKLRPHLIEANVEKDADRAGDRGARLGLEFPRQNPGALPAQSGRPRLVRRRRGAV